MPVAIVANAVTVQEILGALPAGTNNIGTVVLASQASPFTNDLKITLDSEQVDISDRAVRLLGVVYGSQGQQLKQTPTNFNLQSELAVGGALIDPRSIRALTTSDSINLGQWIGSAVPTVGQKLMTESIPVVISSDQVLNIAQVPTADTFFRFGDVVSAAISQLAVRRTTYTEQTSDAQRSIASSSANDTAAGTGARTVRIIYLNSTGAGPFTETVTLNGTTYVNTVATNICFIESIEVLTVGSTGSNVGILTLKAATAGGGATIGTIRATDIRTFWCHHYVPIGKSMNVTGISVSHNGTTVGSGAVFILKAKPIGVVNVPEIQISDFVRLYGQASTFARLYNSPVKVDGPTRVVMYVTSESASTFTYRASFDYFEE